MKFESEDEVIKQKVEDFFKGENDWILPKIKDVEEDEYIADAEMTLMEKISTNLSIVPLKSKENESLGTMVMLEDINERE